jgi:bifunctional non-homologous end joining protein LigD
VRAGDYVPTHGQALFAVIAEHDCEGIVAKRLDAPYRAGRQSTWQKIKNAAYSRREALVWRE